MPTFLPIQTARNCWWVSWSPGMRPFAYNCTQCQLLCKQHSLTQALIVKASTLSKAGPAVFVPGRRHSLQNINFIFQSHFLALCLAPQWEHIAWTSSFFQTVHKPTQKLKRSRNTDQRIVLFKNSSCPRNHFCIYWPQCQFRVSKFCHVVKFSSFVLQNDFS